MTTYEKIQALCHNQGFEISNLGNRIPGISVTKGTISKWKNGAKPRANTLKAIAEYFNLSVSDLQSDIDYDSVDTSGFNQSVWHHMLEKNNYDEKKAIRAYFAFENAQMEDAISESRAAPSQPLSDVRQTTIDNLLAKHPELFRPKMKKVPILGGVACGEPIYSPNLDEEFALINEDIAADFALVCKGDSMIDVGINDGDVVFIRKQEMVDNGQIAAVVIGEEVTLKRVYYYREKNKLILQPENPAHEPLVYVNEELDEIRILGRAVAQLRKIR